MASKFGNFFSKRRNTTPNSPTSESESSESKKAKNLNEGVEDNEQEGDVIIDALEMTGELAETLKGMLEKLQKLDTIENSVKKIETTMENLELRIANLENFQQTATTDIEHLKESVTQNEGKCNDYQRAARKS